MHSLRAWEGTAGELALSAIVEGDDYMIRLWWDLMGVGHPKKK